MDAGGVEVARFFQRAVGAEVMTPREKFVAALDGHEREVRAHWDNMGHGNPVVDEANERGLVASRSRVLAAYDEAARPVAAVEPFAYHWQGLFWYPEELAEEVTTVEQPIPLYVTPASNLPVADESDDRRPPGRS